MKKDYLQQPFELVLKEPMDVCPRGEHSISFFELVYIVSGSGFQNINGNEFGYKEGHVFLLKPEDSHRFTFETTTQLFFIRFNRVFFQNNTIENTFFKRIEQAFSAINGFQSCIINGEEDKKTIEHLMNGLFLEMGKEKLYSHEIIYLLVQSVLTVVARNLIQKTTLIIDEKTEDKAANMIHYVQGNIYHPEKLKSEKIGKLFGVSKTYVGRYFKNKTGKTLSEYITDYKTKLIENRLKYSEMRINEIADEFGFTDKSHLNRFFKKMNGVSPSTFRNENFKKNS
ncbi:AraC-like DNA-binding protein [Chryseobacterium ginsenosidimutans]|uniref:AraC family transcriptional regulator n=1 Tax=Chryseobacterium ginsenosidimutans TaxID=687846 RepID=UPI002787B498|nr:AraC family transcriptional regulator [Chryseobacterium ginsenosidimutans]MDQ0593269.1 AraC-like DNA-binding protein [Chryseobacterium ginsenosidimutans]